MPTIMHDNRAALAMTTDEADQLFQRIAEIVIAANATAAKYEKQLAALKAKAAVEADQFKAILSPLEDDLTAYITARPERFQNPRMRQTEFGKYGLRKVTALKVEDDQLAILSCKAQDVPIVTIEKLDKKAVEDAIKAGLDITGAEIRSGEVVKYDVKKELLDRVRG